MTETEIANLAISLIGGKSLTALDTDASAQAISCRKWFDTARDEALIAHPWNFAMKRARLEVEWDTISNVTNASGLIQITHTSHGFNTGDRVRVRNVLGVTAANGDWTITKVDVHNYTLNESVFSGSYTSGGQATKVPEFGWNYFLALPGDLLALRNVNGKEGNENDSKEHAVEGGLLLLDDEQALIRYTYQVTDTTLWAADFINAFALLLASYIAPDLKGSGESSVGLRQQYEGLLAPKAKSNDAKQGKGRRRRQDWDSDVLRARKGWGLGSYVDVE